jgi:hypothetical protein
MIQLTCEYTRKTISTAAATEKIEPMTDVSVSSPLKSALIFRQPSEIEATDIFVTRHDSDASRLAQIMTQRSGRGPIQPVWFQVAIIT